MRLVAITIGLAVCLGGCSTYREQLNRGQRLYDSNEFEHALAIWRDLENDTDTLSAKDRSRYAYLRGMTDFRLGFRADARHWLAMAKAIEQDNPGGLRPEWKQRIEDTLAELNRDVYGGAEELAADSDSPSAERDPTDPEADGSGDPPGLPSVVAPVGEESSGVDGP